MRFYLYTLQNIHQNTKLTSHLVTKRFNGSQSPALQSSPNDPKYTENKGIDKLLDKSKAKLFEFMSVYEEAIGLREIKRAQETVLQAEKNFVDAQKERRKLNAQLQEMQQKLRNLRDEMDRLSRSDTRYLQLFTEEHNLLKEEVTLINEYKLKENEERDLFFYLSSSLRDSQEKERARVERIKYLQLGLSIICTTLGIISAYLLNYFRNANIREILNYDKQEFSSTQSMIKDLKEKHDELDHKLDNEFKHLNHIIKKIETEAKTIETNVKPPENIEISQSKKHSLKENYVNPYVLSAAALVGFIFFTNK